ncbi:hypothetical protein [Variovorax sp. MHTC-1]|uniref:hypothetical protein n=1 Tax=Variovorax sp. MHTC-1 TaxID=2495593 RepID=UPI000F87968A|nr:hypothetical protein [Variovorax sp. MHTC-1]RST52659.1 hypothetical protein EJI01_15750 [Variovorax sp. MHTC-1]
MPKFLRSLLSIELVFFVCAAAVLPLFESGIWKTIVPILSLVPVFLCIAFWQRLRFSDVALQTYCLVAAMLGITFVALQLLFTSSVSASPSNLILIAETALAIVLYLALRAPSAKRWFSTSDNTQF